MKISTYQICNTKREDHLNGTIVLIRESEKSKEGIAIVIVKENEPIVHSSHADIELDSTSGVWRTINGHNRPNGNIQNWAFAPRKKRPVRDDNDFYCYDNHQQYKNDDFLSYSFNTKGNATPFLEADGSGTAGNTGGGGF